MRPLRKKASSVQPQRVRVGRRRAFSAGVVFATLAALSVVGVTTTIYTKTRQLGGQMAAAVEARFRAVEPLQDEERDALRTYRNDDHVARAESLGVSQLADREEADSLVTAQVLVPLEDGGYYSVREMDYAVPYVTPNTKAMLDSIGARFRQELAERKMPPYRFVITSATRTRKDQERLQGVNSNAAANSSHTFGTTVDLHYADFEYAADQDSVPDGFWTSETVLASMLEDRYSEPTTERNAALKALLGRVLREMQREGSVLVIYERLQPVYHITLGKRIPSPVLRPTQPDLPVQAAAGAGPAPPDAAGL